MSLRQSIEQFRSSTQGNFASMLAITLVPLLAGVGMMIDYTNLTRKQAELQSAVDSAILSAGAYHMEHGSLPSTAAALDMIQVNYNASASIRQFKIIDDEIYLEAVTDTDPLFLDMLGSRDFAQSADATVPVSIGTKVEIAMVLDTTGSMAADGKMVALKSVANDFVRDMIDKIPSGNPDAIKIGLVPFADYVNVGVHNRHEPWLDVPADQTSQSCRTHRPLISKSGCTTTTTNHPRRWINEQCWGPSYNDGVMTSPGGCNPGHWRDAYTSTRETCTTYNYGPEEQICTTHTTTWHGCVGSRNPALNVKDQAYANRVPGLLGTKCTSPIVPLTNHESTLTSAITSFPTSRETYMGAGTAWGNRLLSRRAPFTEGEPYGNDVLKFMIVMSDGDNTRAPNQGANKHLHNSSDTNYANTQTLNACEEAREDDIIIYSISFGTSVSANGKATLEGCAGSASRFFDASDPVALEEAFDSIARDIFKVRLTS